MVTLVILPPVGGAAWRPLFSRISESENAKGPLESWQPGMGFLKSIFHLSVNVCNLESIFSKGRNEDSGPP